MCQQAGRSDDDGAGEAAGGEMPGRSSEDEDGERRPCRLAGMYKSDYLNGVPSVDATAL